MSVVSGRVTFGRVAAIQVRNVPREVHDLLRTRAAAAHLSLNAYLLDVLTRAASGPSTREWLDSLSGREPVTGVDVTATLDRVRRGLRG